jgi:hypothetical protein
MALKQIKTKSFCVKGFTHRTPQPEDIVHQMGTCEKKFEKWLSEFSGDIQIISVSHSHFEKEIKPNTSSILTSMLVVYKIELV